MFYVAQAFLLEAGAAYSRHSAVISAFGEKFAKTGIVPSRLHRYLIDAEAARNIGDYQVTRHVPQERAAALIGQAREFVEMAGQHFA